MYHEARSGIEINWRERFGPRCETTPPAGMAPTHAPNVIRDPIHDPCSLVMKMCEDSSCSIGTADDVHARCVPSARAIRVAEKKRKRLRNLYQTSETCVRQATLSRNSSVVKTDSTKQTIGDNKLWLTHCRSKGTL